MDKKQQILKLVSEYIHEKQTSKKWESGKDWVRYAGEYFDTAEYVASIETLLNGWLVLGEKAMAFEKQFPPLLGKKHGIVTNSGSSSNLLMLAALTSKRHPKRLRKGSKIIVPVAGFPTTLNPILHFGFEPVFVDIELNTLNLNLDAVESLAAKGDCKAIVFAHVLGNPPNMNRLMQIVKKYDLILLEDCCDALGSTYDGKPLGSFGDMASCSFYPAHHITMGEGGFVVTNDPLEEKILRSFREWGRGCYCVGQKANMSKKGSCGCRFNKWIPALPNHIFDHKYVYEEIGYNLKPIEIQCAMGLEQLKKLSDIVNRRKENYSKLFETFSQYENFFHLPRKTENSDPSWFAFPLTIRDGAPFNRYDICGYLEDNKIQTRNYFGGNLLLQPAYSELSVDYEAVKKTYPNATKATTDTFFLGTSPVITDEQLGYIREIVNKFMNNHIK